MNNQLELRHWRYFLAVANNLHFRKAADQLYISQPGLSRQIAQMEESLGFQLFERHNRKVELTAAGKYLQKEINLTFKHFEKIITHAKLLNSGDTGSLKFGYVGSAMQNIIPNLLTKFSNQFPNVHFNMKEIDNQRQIESLLHQQIDIGFVRLERVPKNLTIQPVFEDTFAIVLPQNHRINKRNFKSILQFKNEPFILFEPSYSPAYFEKVMQIFDDAGFTPNVTHETVHASSIFRMVEKKFGVSIVPTSLQLGYNMKIKFIELKKIKQRTTLSAVWNPKNRNPVLNNFLNFIM